MKFSLFSKFMTLMTVLVLAAGAYAAGAAHKGSLQVSGPILVNGTQIPPGSYTVVWDGEGPDTSLHIMQGKKELASAPCKVVALDQKASEDAKELKSSAAGKELTALRFSGQKYQLDVAGESGHADMKSGSTVK